MTDDIDLTVESPPYQPSLATDSRIEGEVTVGLHLPPGLAYDIDDRGDGRLVIQFSCDDGDTNTAESSGTASP